MNERLGVDHRVKLADCEEAPSVAVMALVASCPILPIAAVKFWVVLPAGTTMVPGTVITGEFAAIVTVVLVDAACDRVTVHTLVTLDIMAPGEHVNEFTPNPNSSWRSVPLEAPLYPTVTVPA
jgi:hypothetical protein